MRLGTVLVVVSAVASVWPSASADADMGTEVCYPPSVMGVGGLLGQSALFCLLPDNAGPPKPPKSLPGGGSGGSNTKPGNPLQTLLGTVPAGTQVPPLSATPAAEDGEESGGPTDAPQRDVAGVAAPTPEKASDLVSEVPGLQAVLPLLRPAGIPQLVPSESCGSPMIPHATVEPVDPGGASTCGSPPPRISSRPGGSAEDEAALPVASIGAHGLLSGLAAIGVALVLWSFLQPLYSRLRPTDVLAQPQRGKVLDLIRRHGPIAFPDLLTSLGISRATLRYHVAVLNRAGHLRIFKQGGVIVVSAVVPATAASPAEVVPHVRPSPSFLRLFQQVQSQPGLDQKRLSQDLGISQQRTSFLLRRLTATGLVEARADGTRRTYWAGSPPTP